MTSKNPGLKRTTSSELKQTLYTGDCIISAIDYLRYNSKNPKLQKSLRDKLLATDYSTVVENLIELMKSKGYPNISISSIMVLYNYLFMPIVDRKDIFNSIYKWANMGPCLIPAKNMRNILTFSSSLDSATQLSVESSGGFYYKTWNDIPGPEETLTPNEFGYFKIVLADKKGITLKKTVNANVVRKKKCSTCWLCGNPVYIYKYKNEVLNSCGEDEHVAPPGIGNLAGLLEPTYKATIKHFHDSILISQGLRASHAWCNQAKSDLNFIKPPFFNGKTAKGWSINKEGIESFLQNAKLRLKNESSDAPGKYTYSYDAMFARGQNQKSINTIIAGMKSSIESHINNICKEANKLTVPTSKSSQNNNTAYTACIIRLIFNSCFIGKEYIFEKNFNKKWKSFSKGGGSVISVGGNGPETMDDFLLDMLCKEIMNEGENNCLSSETVIEKFDDNEISIDNSLSFSNYQEIEPAFVEMNDQLIMNLNEIPINNRTFQEYYPELYTKISSIDEFIYENKEEQPVNVLSDVSPNIIDNIIWNANPQEVNNFKSNYFRDTPERRRRSESIRDYEIEKQRLLDEANSELNPDELRELNNIVNRNKSSIRGIKMGITRIKNKRRFGIDRETADDIENVSNVQKSKGGSIKKRRRNRSKKQKSNKRRKQKKTRKQN
jgi:hypothetical protein